MAKVLAVIVIVTAVLPVVMYIPAVQNAAKNLACKTASEKTGMDIKCDRVSIKFPIDIIMEGVSVVDEQGDTLMRFGSMTAGLEMRPLLHGNFKVADTELAFGYIYLADTSSTIKAHISHLNIKGTDFDSKSHVVNVLNGNLDGAKIEYTSKPYKKPVDNGQEEDTAASGPWRINVMRLDVRNVDYTMRQMPSIDKMTAHVAHAKLEEAKINTGECTVNAKSLIANGVGVIYHAPSARDAEIYEALHPELPDTTLSKPWVVNADLIEVGNVDYEMSMKPTMDGLKAHVGNAKMTKAAVNTGDMTVNVDAFSIDGADVKYTTLTAMEQKASSRQHPIVETSQKSDEQPWTVRVNSARIDHSHAVYNTKGHNPKRGLDPDYVEVSQLNVAIDHLYNQGSALNVRVKNISAMERSGINIKKMSGRLAMNALSIDLDQVRLQTGMSDIRLDAHVPLSMMDKGHKGYFGVGATARIALAEVGQAMPDLKPMLSDLPQRNPIFVKTMMNGTVNHLNIKNFTATIPNCAHLNASGTISNPMEVKKLAGDVRFAANIQNVDFAKNKILNPRQRKELNIPPMKASGRVKFTPSDYAGHVDMRLRSGGMLLGSGSFYGRGENYHLDARLNSFPVKAIMPSSPVDDVTASIKASGHGFDYTHPAMAVNASVNVGSIKYDGKRYTDIQARVLMDGGNMMANLVSNSPNCNMSLLAGGRIEGNHYHLDVNGNLNSVDAQQLGLVQFPCNGRGKVTGYIDYNTKTQDCNLSANLSDLNWNYNGSPIVSKSTDVSFLSNSDCTLACLNNEETHIHFESPLGLKDFSKSIDRASVVAQEQLKARNLDINALHQAMPPFKLDAQSGPNGIIPRFLAQYDIDFRKAEMHVNNDSTIYMDGFVQQMSYGSTAIDTITIHANELDDKYLVFKAHMGNRPGTWDDFAQVDLVGGARGATVDFLVKQRNIKGEIGYRIGANATLQDNVVKARLFPTEPILAYRQWEINDSNHIDYNYTTGMLDADFIIKNDSSNLTLRTEPDKDSNQELILLDINRVKLGEWTSYLPNMAPMSGVIDGKVNVLYDGKHFDGNGLLSIKDFVYDGTSEGDIALNTDLSVDPSTGATKLNAAVALDGSQVAVAYGFLNDSTANKPIDLTIKLDRLPLVKVSPFIPGYYVSLDGYAKGEISIGGTTDKMVYNGFLEGDSVIVGIPRYGSSLHLSENRIPIENSVLKLDGTKLIGLNGQAANLSGYCDLNSLDMDLAANGKNVQFVNQSQKYWNEVFGAGFADLDARVTNKSGAMSILAKVDLLDRSDLTYVMQDEVDAMGGMTSYDENMVTFLNSIDSTAAPVSLVTGTSSSSLNLRVDIGIKKGAKFNVFLTPDGKSRVSALGTGNLRYSLDFAGKSNLVGKLAIETGEVRYSPPVISRKVFSIAGGSSIAWTGDIMNPSLDLTGVDKVRTTVSNDDAGSRVVDFEITAKVKNSLSKMDIAFDLDAPADATVQNELEGMTATQRQATAINLLLYNTYSGASHTNNSDKMTANSALISFVQSQLNSWAANNIKGIDLSFGINSYESSQGRGEEVSYSYRLSKSLFNDRFKVVVGGQYSTDATQQNNFADNLFNDISLEYTLNKRGTMIAKLFRTARVESILEGEVTQTGIGFVMKRKLSDLRHLFRFRRHKRSVDLPQLSPTTPTKGKLQAATADSLPQTIDDRSADEIEDVGNTTKKRIVRE